AAPSRACARAVVRSRARLWVVASRARAPAVVRLQVKPWAGLLRETAGRALAPVAAPLRAAQRWKALSQAFAPVAEPLLGRRRVAPSSAVRRWAALRLAGLPWVALPWVALLPLVGAWLRRPAGPKSTRSARVRCTAAAPRHALPVVACPANEVAAPPR
ncbi:hypothetical protein AB0M20_25115, partial [Actinoplanes sp. NPDC051633]|uniref:hypothetical protein n=1 Tax=Actinoplanes sp. NPDC051633 TaxID=3155670 RepID=UPI0034273137